MLMLVFVRSHIIIIIRCPAPGEKFGILAVTFIPMPIPKTLCRASW